MSFDWVVSFLKPILSIQLGSYGTISDFLAYGLALTPVTTLLLQAVEAIVLLTASKKDDEVAKKILDIWENKILPFLEILPHANLPIIPCVKIITKVLGAIKGAVLGWFGSDQKQKE